MAANSPFDCVLVDLDDTLYPGNTGIRLALKRSIDEFLIIKLFRTHGSSLAGLIYVTRLGYRLNFPHVSLACLSYLNFLTGFVCLSLIIPAGARLRRAPGRVPQVGKRVRSKEADYAMESVGGLRRVIPEIWGVAAGGEDHGVETKGMMRPNSAWSAWFP